MNREALLQSVLESYAAETPEGNDMAILKRWMVKHPEFADELIEFAADRAEMEFLPDPEITPEESARFREHGLKLFNDLRPASKKKSVSIHSLTELASQHGLNKQAFAKAVGMSLSLIMYMEKRRLKAASIPDKIIRKTADVLKATKESVEEYLHRAPAAGALSYKAESRPEDVPQKDFAEAVAEDQELTEEQKRTLLENR
jgi:hypothetical protein